MLRIFFFRKSRFKSPAFLFNTIYMIPTLRTLTRKSKLGFGKWKKHTVQEVLNHKKHQVLVYAYYHLTSINFTEDILTELKITEDYRLKKPGSNNEEYVRLLKENTYIPFMKHNIKFMAVNKKTYFTKGQLQAKNHGY